MYDQHTTVTVTLSRNPGIFDKIDADVQKVLLLDTFDGVRLDALRVVGPFLLNSSVGVIPTGKDKALSKLPGFRESAELTLKLAQRTMREQRWHWAKPS